MASCKDGQRILGRAKRVLVPRGKDCARRSQTTGQLSSVWRRNVTTGQSSPPTHGVGGWNVLSVQPLCTTEAPFEGKGVRFCGCLSEGDGLRNPRGGGLRRQLSGNRFSTCGDSRTSARDVCVETSFGPQS
jgi:hypothetical protein